MKENLQATGYITAILFDEFGNIKEKQEGPNLVVTTGLTFLASRAASGSASLMSHMAIGSSATAPALGNTALGTELGRVALTSTTPVAGTVTYVATFPAGTGTGAIAECGLFDAGAAGTMLARSTSISLAKGASDTLQITWAITLS